jgi:UDP-N-acetylmuramoyl-L-alanyl-D-glutamate--2,6-diaminopimelate ligase
MKLLINDIEFWTKLTGSFNAYNILTVFCVAKVFNISDELILKKISSLNSPEGRFELINSNSDKIGIIDYAHSPDSLKQVLKTINDLKNSNDSLITVVGCGGDRDKEKRPLMGKIACSLSDKVIFTSDNPRFEDPEIIINQMKNGVENKDKHKIILELNRKKAIQEACELANKSDIILIAGKGHEKYQIKGDEKIEFNDKKILIETLKINK